MTFCRSCGGALAAGAASCAYCGVPAAPATVVGAVPLEVAAQESPSRVDAGRAKVALAVGVVIVVALARVGQGAAIASAWGIRGMAPSWILSGSLPTLVVCSVLVVGLALRKKWARFGAIGLGALRALVIVAGLFGFAFGGVALALAFGMVELLALVVGAYALLRPGARDIWR